MDTKHEAQNPAGLFVRPPRLVLAALLCVGLIDPVSHVLVANFPPEGTVFTGGHTVDTFNYLTGMRYAHPPWYSPYSLCGDPHADGDASIFAIPHHHLFGLAGTIGGGIRIPPFYMAASPTASARSSTSMRSIASSCGRFRAWRTGPSCFSPSAAGSAGCSTC